MKSGLKLLETRSQKGTAGFTYAGFAWNFKIVLSYPLFAATGAEWHFLCPGGKCPGRSTQEGSLPHRTHVGKRRVILNDSWCPKYNCTKRGVAPFTFFNDHVKALWGAQNIGKSTFLSNNSWLEVGGLAPLTYTVNCKIFAYAGFLGPASNATVLRGSRPNVLGTQRITFLHPPLACSLTCDCFISKVSKVGPHNTYPEHAHAADEAYHILAGKTSLL